MEQYFLIKDTNHKYLSTNTNFSNMLGFADVNDMYGKADDYIIKYSMANSDKEARVLIDSFADEDIHSFRGESLFILDVHYYQNKLNFLLSHKSPFYDDAGKIKGVYCHAVNLGQPNQRALQAYLDNPNISISESSSQVINAYQLSSIRKYKLTPRELDCIRLAIRGNTNPTIADKLKISKRTVETHLDSAKLKMNCKTKNDLIEMAITLFGE